MDGVGVDLREPGVECVDVGLRQAFGRELGAPGPDVRWPHGAELHTAERRPDPRYVDLGLSDGGRPVAAVALDPQIAPLPYGRPCLPRCDMCAGDKLGGL